MTTYTTITIALDKPVPVAAIEARFRAYIARDTDGGLDWLTGGGDGDLEFGKTNEVDGVELTDELSFWANTKYALEGGVRVARSMSGAYPSATVSWSESWDDEDGGENQKDFEAGEQTAERAAQIVPTNLDVLVKELEACVGDGSRPVAVAPALAAARALVKAYRA